MSTEPSPRPRRRGVRRLLRLTIICILLGALTTLAVAWSLAAWLPHSNSITSSWVGAESSPSKTVPDSYVLIDEYVQRGACRRLMQAGFPVPPHRVQSIHGWPVLALTCDLELTDPPYESFYALDGIAIEPIRCDPFGLPNARALPLRPIPRGFALNTALYAAFWFFIFFAPRALLRHLRTTRGHCPRCAYDLTTLPPTTPCPECGTPQLP